MFTLTFCLLNFDANFNRVVFLLFLMNRRKVCGSNNLYFKHIVITLLLEVIGKMCIPCLQCNNSSNTTGFA